MSNITLSSNASGTATFTVASPATNTNQVLTLPDTTGMLTAQGTALTQATAQASTSGTAIDFTGIPSWVKRVTVMFNGVSTSGSSNQLIQIGSGSFDTSGYVGSGSAITTGVTTASYTTGFGINNNASSLLLYGSVCLININQNTWVASGALGSSSSATLTLGGARVLAGPLDRIRVTTVNGTDTFDAGSINIMYEG